MPSPNTTFAFILATLIGALFHLVVGGDARRLALYLLAGWVGFGFGHIVGMLFQVNILTIGALHVFTAVLGAVVALVAAYAFAARMKRKRLSR